MAQRIPPSKLRQILSGLERLTNHYPDHEGITQLRRVPVSENLIVYAHVGRTGYKQLRLNEKDQYSLEAGHVLLCLNNDGREKPFAFVSPEGAFSPFTEDVIDQALEKFNRGLWALVREKEAGEDS